MIDTAQPKPDHAARRPETPDGRLDTERLLIRAAAQRLRSGHPERSNGRLSVSALAAEAGVSRQRLYEHHPDLVAEFKTTAGGAPPSIEVTALERQLAAAHERISELEATEIHLNGQIKTLCAIIAELTQEAHVGNVVALNRR